MSRVLRYGLAVALLAAGLTGCGIPGETEVVVHGPGPSPGVATENESTTMPSPREATRDPEQFVTNFLAAAAGDLEGALDRVRKYLAPDARDTVRSSPAGITVVRLTEKPLITPGAPTVTLRVQHIGVLTANGILEEPTARVEEYTLAISDEVEDGNGLFVTSPPPVLLLSEDALETYYERRPIYFWNTDRTALVPDLRYLPRSIPRAGQPNEILTWLIAGPSRWLAPAVEPLPPDTQQRGNVPDASDGRLQINLSAAALPADGGERAVEQLGHQLMWSLRPYGDELELKIEHQVRRVFADTGYLASNPAHRLTDRPERFVVYEGQVRRRTSSPDPVEPVPVLTDEVNRDVHAAALARTAETAYAALVVGSGDSRSVKVGVAADGQPASFFTPRPNLRGPVSRPVWLSMPPAGEPNGAVGLVAAGGRLYRFGSGGTDLQVIDVPSELGPVTAVAAAPDERRIAFVAGGRAYVSVVTASGPRLELAPARQVRTSLTELTGIDFSGEDSLVVAGVSAATERVAIVDLAVDGALEVERLPDLGNAAVTGLVAYPANPASTSGAATVAYVANGVGYDAFAGPERIEPADVAGVVPDAGSTARPTAPFFLR